MSFPLRWLYIDFNSYFASVEQQLNPALRGKPVAVIPVESDATCAIAASYEAKAFGIRTGTPVYEAKRRCPDLICVLARHDQYVEYHHRALREVDHHIPVSMTCSIDEIACRLMDNENAPERASAIAQSIKAGLKRHLGEHIRCSIGIAPNRYLAKVAADLQKPDGLTLLPASALPGPLLALPLTDLPGIGVNMQRRLARAGIVSMNDLWAHDAQTLRKAWGSRWGEWMWYALRGVEMPEETSERRSVGHSHVLAPELRAPDAARLVARRLMLKAASRLRRLDYYAQHLRLSIRLENGPRLVAEGRCYRAQDSITFLTLLEQLWQQLMREAQGRRIKKVAVTLSELQAAGSLSPELFPALPDLKGRERQERLSHAMDRINQRFGRDAVLIGQLPGRASAFTGTKIAFTRIPDREEFLE